MSKTDPEIRSEISRIKASKKEAKVLDAAFDEGRFAFISGIARDACRFRNPARRNAWERGWLESERERVEHDSIKSMSASEKAKTRENLSSLKEMVKS
jgi:ribosome modulation factor